MFHRFLCVLSCLLFLAAGAGRTEESSFNSNGVRIHYLVEGKGEPVLLIHSFAVNARLQWDHSGIIKALVKDHRVIALDVRGHGKSGKPLDVTKYGTEMVEDAVRLLDHLKIAKVHVVGYSMGALIAGKLLATHPERLLSATLGGSGPMADGAELPPVLVKLAESLEKGKGFGQFFQAPGTPGKSKPDKATLQLLNRSLKGDDGKAMAAVVRSWVTLGVSEEQLKNNKVPTLALIGSKDPYKETIDRIKDDMANLQVVVIDGTSHYDTYLSPKFISNLRKFLKEHKSAPAKPNRGRKGAAL